MIGLPRLLYSSSVKQQHSWDCFAPLAPGVVPDSDRDCRPRERAQLLKAVASRLLAYYYFRATGIRCGKLNTASTICLLKNSNGPHFLVSNCNGVVTMGIVIS